MRLIVLSDQLPVIALVSRYLTNKLIGREPILKRQPKPPLIRRSHAVLILLSESYPPLQGRLLTCYAPVRHLTFQSKLQSVSFDLHVLSTPPAFVLSQNQTLRRNFDWLDRCSKQLPKLTCRRVVKLSGPARWRTNHAAHNLALSSHPTSLVRSGTRGATHDVRRRAGPTL